VNYYDKAQNWEKATIEFRPNEFITGEKERAQEITLYACDEKELAVRHAKLLLNYNKNLIRTCSFDVSVDALACTVGDIILVQHDSVRYGLVAVLPKMFSSQLQRSSSWTGR
jgi:predicted phage tail protein